MHLPHLVFQSVAESLTWRCSVNLRGRSSQLREAGGPPGTPRLQPPLLLRDPAGNPQSLEGGVCSASSLVSSCSPPAQPSRARVLLLGSGHFNPLLKILWWPPLPERRCSLSLVWHLMLCPAPVPWRAPSALKHLSEPPKGRRLCHAPTILSSHLTLEPGGSHQFCFPLQFWQALGLPRSCVTQGPGQDTDHVPPGPRGSLPTVSS